MSNPIEYGEAYRRYVQASSPEERLDAVRATPNRDLLFLSAAFHGDLDAMETALRHGANLDAVHPILGDPALVLAASTRNVDARSAALAFLLDRGIDVYTTEFTALHALCLHGAADAEIRLLVEGGIAVDTRDEFGSAPLHAVPGYTGRGAAPELLRLGADVNAKDLQGRTPLHSATSIIVEQNVPAIAELCATLLAAGADPLARDDAGRTPLDSILDWPELASLFVPFATVDRIFPKGALPLAA